MIQRLTILFGLLATSCHDGDEKSTYAYRRNPDGEVIRTEMRHGSANGRIIAYTPNGKINAIMHVQDSVLTGNTYRFYPSGHVAQITPYARGYMNGRVRQFYDSGGLKSIETYVKDEKTGPARGYYPNGSLQYTVKFWRGQATGDYLDFYEVPPNRVRRRVEYVLVRGKQWGNGHIDYSPTGAITKRFEQLDAIFNQPRYSLSDTVVLTLRLHGPQFKRLKATVADFDSLFNGNDTTAGHVVYGHRGSIRIPLLPRHTGLNYVRGYVTDYDSGASPQKGSVYQMKEKNVYFQSRYWVDL
ncbi:toxin-antitoxin system YwqK family antitoxin [Hymenobacter puniceus]|uniref:toxin-antitoxin system YwqK family antitoxin n=1 Tax=Hymenobacter sp. BT190 TaxID=2763505 RepID=UPI0016515FA2|nr:hypothetical protein [Hymenobacter sp. BT190]MBC6698729.1 hypothetical protein [Hymenobacter sp. BT190]